jgi:hypothetical protein
MTRRLIIILFLAQILIPDCFPQNYADDHLLRETIRLYGQARVSIPFPGARVIGDLSDKVSISSIRGKTVEIVVSPRTAEWFISQKFNYRIIENTDSKGIITSLDLKQAMEWESYPSYDQYDSIMQSFATLHPALCQLDTIGISIYGKLVLALKISDNADIDEDEPETFFSSTIHGDETGGFVMMLHLADYLIKNYSTDSRVKNLVDNLEIWINPLANPDGTYHTGNTISSPIRDNANGYDLNRNFPDPETPNTEKQKETIDMMKFLREHKFVLSANFHSGEEVVNYPWDRWSFLHADNDWFYSISRKYADTVHLNSVVGYMTFMENGVTNGYDWYKINGGRQDFVTWELQGREVTIELDDSYVTPAANLTSLWQYNRYSLLGYLENALYGIHGTVKDELTGAPVNAKVFISNHDKDSSHVYSDPLSGSFVRLIAPGTWDILFIASGYFSKEIKDVTVADGQKTALDVKLIPILNPLDTVQTYELILYPNPAKEYMKVILPEWQIGIIKVRIYNSLGVKLADYIEHTLEGLALEISVTNLAEGAYSLVITNTEFNITDKARFVVVHH